MKRLEQIFTVHAPATSVWQALTDAKTIGLWGAGPAVMEPCEGTKFELWGGSIHGNNVIVVKNEMLVQNWTSSDAWKAPSRVTFVLRGVGDATKVHITQENIPDEDFEAIEAGWNEYYAKPIKALLEG